MPNAHVMDQALTQIKKANPHIAYKLLWAQVEKGYAIQQIYAVLNREIKSDVNAPEFWKVQCLKALW